MAKKYTTDSITVGGHNLTASMMESLNIVVSNYTSYLTSVPSHNQAWSTITGTPTTLAGYGITDGLSSEHNHDTQYLAITGKAADSNLLDGIDSSQFLRSDVDDTTTGKITFAKGSSGTLASRTGFSDFLGYNPSYGSYIGGGPGNASGRYLYAGGYINNGTSVYTLWHSGNDGSGSWLDADLLDGNHASAFATASHNHDSVYVKKTGDTMSGVYTLSQNPVGTTYGDGVSTVPSTMITQTVGDNDGWRLYGESPASNDVKMIFEVVDDNETGDTWVFRNKRTYSSYAATEDFKITGEGHTYARGNGYVNSNQRVFADNYHPNADKWTTARTITIGNTDKSVDGSANVSWSLAEIGAQPAGTYNTIIGTDTDINTSGSTIIDNIYVTDGVITSMGTRSLSPGDIGAAYYDHFRSLGVPAFTAGGGSNSSTTTSQLITEMENDGAFDSYTSAFKTSWSYASNDNLTDAGRFTETAGTSWLTWTDNSSDSTRGNITALAIAPNTGGSAGKVFIYNDQGSGYYPGWREVWTSTSDGSGSGLDADLLDGNHASAFATASHNHDSVYVKKSGDTMSGTLTIDTGGNSSDALVVKGASPTINLLDDDGGDDFYIHVNSNNFYVLANRDANDLVGTGWESPHPLQLEADTNIGYLFGARIFTDNYHPDANKLTTARTIAGSSFDGSANIDISYNNLTNKPTIPSGSSLVKVYNNVNYVPSDPTSSGSRANYGTGLTVYEGYSSGSNRPHTYDATLQIMPTSNQGFELSADWVSNNTTPLKIRSLRDCCAGWSPWRDIPVAEDAVAGNFIFANKVSIGKTSVPTQALDVAGNVTVSGTGSFGSTVDAASPNINNWIFKATNSDFASESGFYDANNHIEMILRNSSDAITTHIKSSGSSFFNGGNVGIGTIDPQEKLDVNGNIYLSGLLPQSSIIWKNPVLGTGPSITTNSAAYLIFETPGAGQAMTIENAGDVGIGVTNPVEKLDVAGNINTTGDIIVDSSHGFINSGAWTRNATPYGYIDFGPANTGHAHIYTDRPNFYFNKQLQVLGGTVWNSGNDGSGSGLDADLLDGVHGGSFLRSDATDVFSGDLISSSGASISVGYNVSSITNTVGASNWFRSSGATGWFNGTYGGGIHMTDYDWVRVYNSKKFHVSNDLLISGDFRSLYVGGLTTSSQDGLRMSIDNAGSGYIDHRGAGSLHFRVDNSQGASTRMVINAAGNVGIGTTSPGDKLDIRPDDGGDTRYITTFFNNSTTYNAASAGTEEKVVSGLRFRWYNEYYQIGATRGGGVDIGDFVISDTGQERLIIKANGSVGIGSINPYAKLHVQGDIYATTYINSPYITADSGLECYGDFYMMGTATIEGDMYADAYYTNSDEKLKTNIQELSGNAVNVNWKSFEFKEKEGKTRVGVIAQELEQNHPEFVSTSKNGFKTVNYIELLIAKIAELETRIKQLENNG